MGIKAAIFVNLSANNNRGEEKWLSIRDEVLKKLPQDTEVISYVPPFEIKSCIEDLIRDKDINCIISAGGDGSINYILNALMDIQDAYAINIHLGAIGLGSSNDFLKPDSKVIKEIPVRINTEASKKHDVGRVSFINSNHQKVSKCFIINASVGVTADANKLFNEGDLILRRIKSRFVGLAISYAALKTIIGYKNKGLKLIYNDKHEELEITNLSVVKNPNISGSFRYDQKIEPDDGLLGINYCYAMNAFELIRVLIDLSKGKFSGKRKRVSVLAKTLFVETDGLLALETDGEVDYAKHIEFSILPEAIHVLAN